MIAFDLVRQAGAWSAVDGAAIARALRAAEAAGRLPRGTFELSLVLSDDAHVRELNREWRGIDKPTNVLSFPAEDRTPHTPPRIPMLGDVVMAHETVLREAAEQSKRSADHFTHLLVHGVLHLFGHDHDTDAAAERMESIEIAALATLGIADPYAHYDGTEAGDENAR